MKLGIIGAGHVGLVSGVCFAELGNNVICIDNNAEKIDQLKNGVMPIYEPGLEELVHKNVGSGRLSFSTEIGEAVKRSQVLFICVGTPPKEKGDPDLSTVEFVTRDIAQSMDGYRLVVEKSTVPVQTGGWIRRTMQRSIREGTEFDVACNPEFLREGAAIEDFMKPDRIVIGVESERAKELLLNLYEPLKAPIIVTDIQSAELIKHASNSFLAMKISFINSISILCEKTGADITRIAEGIGYDKRIGKQFLNAGVGFGGFCFPKDLKAFIWIAEKLGYNFGLLKEVERINEEQQERFIEKIEQTLWNLNGKTIGVLGLSFKPNTDDMRFAPSIKIIKSLQREGAKIKVFDPAAINEASKIFKDIQFCHDPYEVAKDADALVILTEWDEFKKVNLEKVKGLLRNPVIIDGRNIYEPKQMSALGFTYKGIGR
jgi:UDPglucose 6-dehydrogenase